VWDSGSSPTSRAPAGRRTWASGPGRRLRCGPFSGLVWSPRIRIFLWSCQHSCSSETALSALMPLAGLLLSGRSQGLLSLAACTASTSLLAKPSSTTSSG